MSDIHGNEPRFIEAGELGLLANNMSVCLKMHECNVSTCTTLVELILTGPQMITCEGTDAVLAMVKLSARDMLAISMRLAEIVKENIS